MVYKIIQYILRIYLPVFFKRIEFRGLDNVAQDKPVIYTVNHQNAFMDGVLTALLLKKPVYFLTRSDVFKGKWVVKIFTALNLVPIFRRQDGTANIHEKNMGTFAYCIKALEKKKPILIFPEGQSMPVHHFFGAKKGVARLAFSAEEANNFKLNIHVIPVSINYENHFIGGKKVFVNYGDPIKLSDYKDLHRESPSKARNVFLEKLSADMKNNLIHITGNYSRFKRKYWKGIIRQSRNDKEIIAAVKSIPTDSETLNLEGYNWKKEKYRYNRPRPAGVKFAFFLICLPAFIIFLPTILITKLIVAKINDHDFHLSTVSLSWLLFGITQTNIIAIYLWNQTTWDIFTISLLFIIVNAYIGLRNFYKIF